MSSCPILPTWELHQAEALLALCGLKDETVDAVITDPPYSSGGFTHATRAMDPHSKYVQHGQAKTYPTYGGDNRNERSWLAWSTLWLTECFRILRPGGYAMMFTDWRMLPTASDAFQAGGFVWRGLVAWDKTEGSRAPHKGYFRHQCEYVIWGTKGQCAVPDVDTGHPGPFPGCFRFPVLQRDKHHMTGKPTALMRELAKAVRPGGLIVDPFAGSASTGVGALLEGRSFYGIEREPAYFTIGRDRLTETLQNLTP